MQEKKDIVDFVNDKIKEFRRKDKINDIALFENFLKMFQASVNVRMQQAGDEFMPKQQQNSMVVKE